MASKRFRSDKERDPIAELARLISQADSHEESAPSGHRLREQTAPDRHDEVRELPPAPQLPVALNEDDHASERDMHYSDDQARDGDDDFSVAEREYQDGEVPGYPVEEQQDHEVPHYPLEDEHRDNEVLRGRRRRLTLAMAIVGLALLGSAGAVAYRNMFTGPVSSTLPPSIKATNEPNTIPSVSGAQTASTGNTREIEPVTTGSIDNMVSRKDQPAVARSKSPGASFPRANVPAAPSAGQAIPSGPPAAVTAPAPRLSTAAASSRPGQSGGAEDTVASSREHLAAIPVAHPNADTSPAGTPTVVTNGYAVQVTSERSESRAQAAFRALQAKYPNQLGGHQPMIRRADLGAAGVYYRALVGPFASAEKATKLCSGLKAVGGDCLIQKNP